MEVTPFSEGLGGVAIVDVLVAVDCRGAAGATINGLPPCKVQRLVEYDHIIRHTMNSGYCSYFNGKMSRNWIKISNQFE